MGSNSRKCYKYPTGGWDVWYGTTAIYLARTGHDKAAIRRYITHSFGYPLDRTVAEMRPGYKFTSRAVETVPHAIVCFLESQNFDDCLRLAISLGGIAGAKAGTVS